MSSTGTAAEAARLDNLQINPIALITVGTTSSEVNFLATETLARMPGDQAPFIALAVDTMPYEDHINRHIKNGWPQRLVEDALPRSHYFHIDHRFDASYDFTHPLNRAVADAVFDPQVRRVLSRPDAPGASGIPLAARVRGLMSFDELVQWLEPHLRDLARVRIDCSLKQGAIVHLVTAWRGATGVGAHQVVAAAVKRADEHAQVHVRALLPDAWDADRRVRANAYAAAKELRFVHRHEGRLPLLNDRTVAAPCDVVALAGHRNGGSTAQGVDLIAETASVVLSYVRPHSQSTMNGNLIDLETPPYDVEDNPTHLRQETALTIRVARPQQLDFMATWWLEAETEAERASMERYLDTRQLTEPEEERAMQLVERACTELGITGPRLLERIDGPDNTANQIRRAFEQFTQQLSVLGAAEIKDSTPVMIGNVRSLIDTLAAGWDREAWQLAESLPREISAFLLRNAMDRPAEYFEALDCISRRLQAIADEARETARAHADERDGLRETLAEALNAVQESEGVLFWFRKDEVARDAALQALACGNELGLVRREHELAGALDRLIRTGIARRDHGQEIVRPGVCQGLEQEAVRRTSELRQLFSARKLALGAVEDELRFDLTRHSAFFERDLVFGNLDPDGFVTLVDRHRRSRPRPDAIVAYLRSDEPSFAVTIAELRPLLPLYSEAQRPLAELLRSTPELLASVIEQLRNSRPFCTLDKEVEDQQELRQRHDTLRILELPGGKASALVEKFREQDVVSNINHVVDSGAADEIRYHFIRVGLPYESLADLKRLRSDYRQYLERPTVTPHSLRDGEQLPDIESPTTNLRQHADDLVALAQTVLPGTLEALPNGRLAFHYLERQFGTDAQQTAEVGGLSELATWLRPRVKVRKQLEAKILEARHRDPRAYQDALLRALDAATRAEDRDRLRRLLLSLGIDPARRHINQTVTA